MTYRNMVVLALGLCLSIAYQGRADWPCYHGPQRDNRATETNLMETWPENGPTSIWTAAGLGHGYSSVAVTGDRIVTAGTIDKVTHVTALDLTGKTLWQRPNGPSWEASAQQTWAVSYSGSRGTPTLDGDTVYHLSELGDLRAFDLRTGDTRWHVNVLDRFEGERPEYGISESVLIDGDAVICCPAGNKGYMVALNKHNGQTLWTNTDIQDAVGNSSAVRATLQGVDQIIALSASHVFAVNPTQGKLLWQAEFGNARENNCTDVVVTKDRVFVSSGYGKGSALLRPIRLDSGSFTVEKIWTSTLLDNHHGGVVTAGDYVYGAGHEARGWFCLDINTGNQKWNAPGKGTLTYADNHLYCLDEKGTLSLVKCTADKWNAVSAFQVPRGGKGLFWAHPVVCQGRLYIRHSDQVMAYAIGKEPVPAR
ncbi:MAG: PQQ-like beta-propeller repeat protein [Phycisphaerae bacterium]|nr:PQQ-like beta-propeller repeat protein [Phycisphaerae bacterium]